MMADGCEMSLFNASTLLQIQGKGGGDFFFFLPFIEWKVFIKWSLLNSRETLELLSCGNYSTFS